MSRFRTLHLSAALAASALLAAGCGQGQEASAPTPPTAEDQQTSAGPAPEEASWSYEGETGPENWAELEADYATCGTGSRQSPVDLIEAEIPTEPIEGADAADVVYDYQPATYELVDTGHTIQADTSSAGGITIDDKRYELLQFHAHAPSEHALDGQRTDLEVHLVHQSDDGELAVVGVLVEAGTSESSLAQAWRELPAEGETLPLTGFDASTLLPEDRTTFRYDGSLTTPPCTEGVKWLVMQETVTTESDVIRAFEDAVGESARPLQPLGDREVVRAPSDG